MKKHNVKQIRRSRRKAGIRKRVTGTPDRPRLTVFRSNKHVYAQIVDDLDGRTLLSASSVQAKLAKGADVSAAAEVGKALAEKVQAAGIRQLAFDRNGFKYHGRVKALADAVREAGVKF